MLTRTTMWMDLETLCDVEGHRLYERVDTKRPVSELQRQRDEWVPRTRAGGSRGIRAPHPPTPQVMKCSQADRGDGCTYP